MKINKYLTICLVALMALGMTTAKAQIKVKFGPRAAFTLNTMSYSEKIPDTISPYVKGKKMDYSYRMGFNAGMFLDVRINSTITLGTEFFVSKQGGHAKVQVDLPTASGDYEGDITTYYLQMPLLFKVSPFTGFNVELGPQVGYLLAGEKKYQYSENIKDWGFTTEMQSWEAPRGQFREIEEDASEIMQGFKYYNRWDFSVAAGVNYRIDLEMHGNEKVIGLVFGARYTYGLFNTLNELKQNKKGEWTQEEVDSKNSSIALSVAVRF